MACMLTIAATAGAAIFPISFGTIWALPKNIPMMIGAGPLQKGEYVTGLVTAVTPTFASIKIGAYHAMLTPADFAWTGHKSPSDLLKVGDLVMVSIKEVSGTTAQVQLEQQPAAQAGAALPLTIRPAKSKPWWVAMILSSPSSIAQLRPCGRREALSRCTFTPRRSSRAPHLSIPSSTRRSPTAAVA